MTDLPFLTNLNPDQQREAGLPEIWPIAIQDRVRFGEVDKLGHVNNARYFSWCEDARTAHLRLTGIYDGAPARIVIRSGTMHWVKEILPEERYIVTARAIAYRRTSFTVRSEIWAGDLRARFECVCVTLEPDGSARRPLPDTVITHLQKVDGAIPE